MYPKAATLFGYTHEEALKYFPGRIHELAEAAGLTDQAAFWGLPTGGKLTKHLDKKKMKML